MCCVMRCVVGFGVVVFGLCCVMCSVLPGFVAVLACCGLVLFGVFRCVFVLLRFMLIRFVLML